MQSICSPRTSPWHGLCGRNIEMDYIKPPDVVDNLIKAGIAKSALSRRDLLIRGFLSGALLAFATSLALTATVQTGSPLVGALVFPVGFVMIVLLGLELVTGSFAVVPLARIEGKTTTARLLSNLFWVFSGNLIGSIFYGVLFGITLTAMGTDTPNPLAAKLVAIAESKTIGYAKFPTGGMAAVFVKAILCNWMVTLGVVMAMTSASTVGKIVAAWLPILTFFAQGFEHSVVNMFVIPTGMMMGAKVTFADWWFWNQIPVTAGNFVGGFLFTGLALYLTLGPRKRSGATTAGVPAGELTMEKQAA
jgi:formate transporter